MQLGYYALSSRDPDNYNKINANIEFPYDFIGEVKMTVISLNTNCNIEVLNENDFLEIEFINESKKIYINENYSKLTLQSLPYIFNELFKNNNIPITCDINQLDILIFTSKKRFYFTNMSYNLKLITGLYYHDFKNVLTSKMIEVENDNTIKENILLKSVEIGNMISIKNEWQQVNIKTEPPDAYGYRIIYERNNNNIQKYISDNKIYFKGLVVGTYTIKLLFKQNNIRDIYNEFTFEVIEEDKNIKLNNLIVIKPTLELLVDEEYPITFIREPINAILPNNFLEDFKFVNEDNEEVLPKFTITKNIINGLYIINALSSTLGKIIVKYNNKIIFNIIIKDRIEKISKHFIIPKSVGLCLSTPILYLTSNVGGKTFRNEENEIRMQSCNSVMIINNSYSSSFPIVAENTIIYTECDVKQLTNLTFDLVDANMRPIKLLNPMYITIILEPLQRNESLELIELFKSYNEKRDELEKIKEEKVKEVKQKQEVQQQLNLFNYHDFNNYTDPNLESIRVFESMKY